VFEWIVNCYEGSPISSNITAALSHNRNHKIYQIVAIYFFQPFE